MNDEDIIKIVKALRTLDSTEKVKPVKEVHIPTPAPVPVERVNKFHHGQKVTVMTGYYATYKGYIKDMRKINGKYEYLLFFKKIDDKEEWIPEEYLKRSMF